MKNFNLFFSGVMLFFIGLTACGPIEQTIPIDEKMLSYEVTLQDQVYYFYYPVSAIIHEESDGSYLEYNDCKVNFGYGFYNYSGEDAVMEVEKIRRDGSSFEASYQGGKLVSYAGIVDEVSYIFWTKDNESGVSNCMGIVNELTNSFSDEPDYRNDHFNFEVDLPTDYKVENLPSGEGVVLKKWILEEGEEMEDGYKVEMAVFGADNVMEYGNVGELIADKYDGYSVEFGDEGVYIDEGADSEAIRHYFIMSDDSKIIYEAYLIVPSLHYGTYKSEFSDFVRTIEVF